MTILTKKYRVTWKDNRVITLGKFASTSSTGCLNGFDFDTKQEVTDKVTELDLTMTEDQENEWSQIQ